MVIPFCEFMANDPPARPVYLRSSVLSLISASAITHVSLKGLLNVSPVVTQGYLIMIAVGVAVVGVAACERFFIGNGFIEIAESIVDIIKVVLPFAFIGALVAFVYMNPLL
jgi:hypothetical protein